MTTSVRRQPSGCAKDKEDSDGMQHLQGQRQVLEVRRQRWQLRTVRPHTTNLLPLSRQKGLHHLLRLRTLGNKARDPPSPSRGAGWARLAPQLGLDILAGLL